ncbi:myb family transcription factor EFM-like [Tripterygium wilfordii]|uniref:myb family transcription factor EFM-like n=1 Tax=Tripterygium wilfordii TaxID=458696 RepID=UPI0018F856A6|nr:myb family transcription factor EFM-like [Tripterygium wilfordii]
MKPSYVPKSISSLLQDLENIDDIDDKLEFLDFHLHQHELEMKWVEVAKDLFPQCMLLLMDAVETLREEIAKVKATKSSASGEQEIGRLEKKQRMNSNTTESAKGTKRLRADYRPKPLTDPTGKNNRRCWTSELHNHFVRSVEILGGPEVATPSEIKILMEAEGLSTDQVKSHLQRYRLQSRRASQPSENPVKSPQGHSNRVDL